MMTMFARVRRLVSGAASGLALVMLGISLASCTPGADLTPIPSYQPDTYRLGVDDQIRVITFGEDQLTLEFRIDGSGHIAFPLLGSITAAGLTTSELASAITAELEKREVLKSPSVSVEVTAYRLVSVLGEVAKPGQYPYQPGMTMLTAVAAAGGFTYRAFEDYAYVVREQPGGNVTGRIAPQDQVKPGDAIKVYERTF